MSDNVLKIDRYTFEIGFEWITILETKKVVENCAEKGCKAYSAIVPDNELESCVLGVAPIKASQSKSFSLYSYVFQAIKNLYDTTDFVFIKEIAPNRFYHAYVDNGYPGSNSDIILPEDADIEEFLNGYLESNVLIYIDSEAPEKIFSGDFVPVKIDSLFVEHKPSKKHEVVDLNRSTNAVKVVSLSVVLITVLSYIGNMGYEMWFKKEEVKTHKASRAELAIKERKRTERIVAERLLLKTKAAAPGDIVNSCIESYYRNNGSDPIFGWSSESVKCNQSGLQTVFVQNDVFSGDSNKFQSRMKALGNTVSIHSAGNWLASAKVRGKFDVKPKSRGGLLPEQLPNKALINAELISVLGKEVIRGVHVGRFKERMEVFDEKEEIPDEIKYWTGSVVITTSSLDHMKKVSEKINNNYVLVSDVTFKQEKLRLANENDNSLSYQMTVNYVFK